MENLFVKYPLISPGHRLGVGVNTVFKIKLTPQLERPVFFRNPPTPTNLRDDLMVDFALVQT